MKLIYGIFLITTSFLLQQSLQWQQIEIPRNPTTCEDALWYNGIQNGSCSQSITQSQIDLKFLKCNPKYVAVKINEDKSKLKINKCYSDLVDIYNYSPINSANVEFRDLPKGIRTVLCAMYLFMDKDTEQNYFKSILPKFSQDTITSFEDSPLFTNAASQNWRGFSYYQRIFSILAITEFLQNDEIEQIPEIWFFVNGLGEVTDNVFIKKCDYCNICQNKCKIYETTEEIKKNTKSKIEYDAEVKATFQRKQDACPYSWKYGIPGGYKDYSKQFQETANALDLLGEDYKAAETRVNFVNSAVNFHFLSCQLENCNCPYMRYKNQCGLHSDESSAFIGLRYNLQENTLPWKYCHVNATQRDAFDNLYGKSGSQVQSILKNKTLSMNMTDFNNFTSYQLAKQISQALNLGSIPSEQTINTNLHSLAVRTALTSASKTMESEGRDPTDFATQLNNLAKDQNYTEFLQLLRENDYQNEADIVSYSLLPFPCTKIRVDLIILIDKSANDQNNGELVKKCLKQFVSNLDFSTQLRFELVEFQPDDSKQGIKFTVLSPLDDYNKNDEVTKSLDKIKLQPSDKYVPLDKALNYASYIRTEELKKNPNLKNEQIVVFITDGNVDLEKQQIPLYFTVNLNYVQFRTICLGIGPDLLDHWPILYLLGRDLKKQQMSLKQLQTDEDIQPIIDYMQLQLQGTCYWPSVGQLQQEVKLQIGQMQFFKFNITIQDVGMHLIIETQAGDHEIYGSFHEYPSKYNYDFQLLPYKGNEGVSSHFLSLFKQDNNSQKKKKYILNMPLYTHEFSKWFSMETNSAYLHWKRPLYVGIKSVANQNNTDLVLRYKFYKGVQYEISFGSYIGVLIAFFGLIMLCSICALCYMCRQNRSGLMEKKKKFIKQYEINQGGGGGVNRKSQSVNKKLDTIKEETEDTEELLKSRQNVGEDSEKVGDPRSLISMIFKKKKSDDGKDENQYLLASNENDQL